MKRMVEFTDGIPGRNNLGEEPPPVVVAKPTAAPVKRPVRAQTSFTPVTWKERATANREFEKRYPPDPLAGCRVLDEVIIREDENGEPCGYDVYYTYYRRTGPPVPIAHRWNNAPPVMVADMMTHSDESSSRPKRVGLAFRRRGVRS